MLAVERGEPILFSLENLIRLRLNLRDLPSLLCLGPIPILGFISLMANIAELCAPEPFSVDVRAEFCDSAVGRAAFQLQLPSSRPRQPCREDAEKAEKEYALDVAVD